MATQSKRKLANIGAGDVHIIHNDIPLAAILELDNIPMIDVDVASLLVDVSPKRFAAGRYTEISVGDEAEVHRFITLDALLQQVNYHELDESSWVAVRLYLNIAQYWSQLVEMESRISIHHFITCVALMTRHHSLSNH